MGSRRRFAWWVYVIGAIPLVGLVAVGVYIGSVIFVAKQAADTMFVPSARLTYATATVAAAAATAPGVPTPQGTPVPHEAIPAATPAAPPTAAPQEILPEWEGTERINVLLLGVDKREDEEVPRSDTMILVSIDPTNKRVGILSFPRDLWVMIPGHGPDKINSAFPLGEMLGTPGGGPALAMQTVEANFKIPVHHFATVDFRGFIKIIDAVGGVTVEVPYPIKDDAYPTDDGSNYMRLYVPAGLQHMDGVTALRYARSRNFDTDFGRQRRQQQILQSIRERGLKLDLLPRLPEFITTLSSAVRTDFDPRNLPALARLGTSIDRENIKIYGITPEMTVVHDSPQIYYLEPAWSKINVALREMLGVANVGGSAALAPTPTRLPAVPRAPVVVRPTQAPPTPAPRPTSTPAPSIAKPTATSPRSGVAASPTVAVARPRVWVRNGTMVQGLAARNAEVLRGRGYPIVDVSQDPNSGKYPRSIVYNYGASQAQALAVADLLGLPASAVRLGPAPAPAGTDLLVILGDDAAR
jgi:LCP family protein required for cell wall assembly